MKDEYGLNAIIAAFIRYTEFSSINYEACRNIVKIEIAFQGDLREEQINDIVNNIRQSLELFYKMSKIITEVIKLDVMQNNGITILSLYRDVKTLGESEMDLLVLLLRQEYAPLIVKDNNDILIEESVQKTVKNDLLKQLKIRGRIHNIFAYRDKGKVFVFNK